MPHTHCIRITELRLPLEHPPEALPEAIAAMLGRFAAQPLNYTVFRRSYDARGKSSQILFSYIVDVVVTDRAAALAHFAGNKQISPTPDMRYHFVGHANAISAQKKRPVVVGFGPCGIFAALILSQMGLRPLGKR